MWCPRVSSKESFDDAFAQITSLEPFQRKIIEERYIHILSTFERRANLYAFLFHVCRFSITVGSLIVPALLSIQYIDTSATPTNQMNATAYSFQIYWTTWVISLLVTTSNGIFTLFKIDKKYYLLHTMLEQLRSEGWQYLELSGRFSGFYTPRERPTHANQFLFFCHVVEKLKMRQVEEEYYKTTDSSPHTSSAAAGTAAGAGAGAGTTNHHSTTESKADIELGDTLKNTIHIPAFYTDGLIPPTPLNPQLQQLLQALSIEGVNGTISKKAQGATTSIQNNSEMSMRSEMSEQTLGKESFLRKASEILPATESINRLGTEIQSQSVEQKS